MEGDICDVTNCIDPFLDCDRVWEMLERKAAEVITDEIYSVVHDAQRQYRSDILGLGVTLYRHHTSLWRDLEG